MINNSIVNNFENGVDTMINTDATEEIVMNTEVTTNTNDVPQPFPAPLAQPASPDAPASDPTQQRNVPVHSIIPVEDVSPTLLSMINQTAVAPHVSTAVSAQPATAKMQVSKSNKQYIMNGEFDQDIDKNKKYANRKTGYPNLDAIHSLQPGLYMILAETSAGKTTFTLQLSDQIAIQGEYVLYFALEQSQFYLTSKSLSRQFFWAHREDEIRNGQSNLPCYTSLEIRNGCVDDVELNKQEIDYAQAVQDRMHVISTNFSGGINEICECVEEFIQQTGHKPVVVVDYIQIVPPITAKNGTMLDTKTSLDQGIHKLKQFQDQNDLTVMVISSLSRQGYAEAISLSHAKESGSLEYTCDFCFGIQLREISECNNSVKKISDADKKKRIANAKKQAPRKIEVVYLKDRCGSIGETAYFDYYSAYETFVATDENGNPM